MSKKTPPQITVIIPAAGIGRRMKSYGPISLVRIGEKTLIERQIEAILFAAQEPLDIESIRPQLKIKIDMNEYHNYNYNFLNIFNFDVSPYYNLIQSSLLFDLIKFYKYLYLRSIKLNKLYPDIINQLKPIKEIQC